MPLTEYQIQSGAPAQFLSAPGAREWLVTNGSATQPLTISSDPLGENVLATIAAGITNFANFTSYGGFYYSSPFTGGATAYGTPTKMYRIIANGTTVTNATAETNTAQFLIPANFLTAGHVIRVRYKVEVQGVTGSPTLQAILRLGSAGTSADTALITTTAETATTSTIAAGEFLLQVRTVPSATSSIAGVGTFSNNGTVAAQAGTFAASLTPTNFATNAALYISLDLVWSAASTSNQAAATVFEVEIE